MTHLINSRPSRWGHLRGIQIQAKMLYLALLLTCLPLLIGCHKGPKQVGQVLSIASANASPKKGAPPSKETLGIPKEAKLAAAPKTETRVLVGSVQSNRKVVISPEVGGIIKKIYVKKGDYVTKNQRLIWTGCQDYTMMAEQSESQVAIAKAGIQLAQAQLSSATKEHSRFRMLLRKRSISQYQFDKMEMGRRMASIQLTLAQKRLGLALVGLRIAKTRRGGCSTTAPFAGVVTDRMLDEGTLVRSMPPSSVLMLQEVDPIIIEVPMGEMYIKELKHTSSIKVIIPSLGSKPLFTLTRKTLTESMMPSLNVHNRSVTLRISLPNKDRKLKPGMSAEIHLTQQTHL